MDTCPTCGKDLGDDYQFHMVASPNADALTGQYRGFPRYTLHREHIRQSDSWDWDVLCKACYEALPCAPSGNVDNQEFSTSETT